MLVKEKLFVNLLKYAGYKEPSFSTNASENVELVSFESKNCILISAYYISDADKIDVMIPFEISVKSRNPKSVILLRTGEKIEFTYENGYTIFKTDFLHIFDMYKIDFLKV